MKLSKNKFYFLEISSKILLKKGSTAPIELIVIFFLKNLNILLQGIEIGLRISLDCKMYFTFK